MSKQKSSGMKIQWGRLLKKLSPGSLTVEYKKKCLQALWYLLFLRQIICFIL